MSGTCGMETGGWSRILLELCAIHGIAAPLAQARVHIDRERFSPESLMSHMFGMPTSIRGFDDLFGGGGLMLIDDPYIGSEGRLASAPPRSGGGRTVLAIGPFGTGKSSLTFQMAVEVARKGGIAWVMALEQPAEECCILLESLGIAVHDRSFQLVLISDNYEEAFDAVMAPEPGRGVLLFDALHPQKEDFQEFIDRASKKFNWLLQFPLRLILADPVNAVLPPDHRLQFRHHTLDFFSQAKQKGINIWLTCEQVHERSVEGQFPENIADTVIRLNVERDRAYQQRHIEVTKSRLQKEAPGRHSLRLSGGPGVAVDPPPERYIRTPQQDSREVRPVRMFIPGLDDVIGDEAVFQGDLVALHGLTGTSKTLFGLLFLRGYDADAEGVARSLLISDFSVDRMKALVQTSFRQTFGKLAGKKQSEIELHHVSPGFADTGEILRGIRAKLDEMRESRQPADRVMISNISRWELDMPLLADDLTFGVALLSLLRSYGVTAVIVCGYSSERSDTALKNVILETCDCALDFSKLEFRGQERQFVRAVKTHRMTHRRGRFELEVGQAGVSVTPKESLLRLDASGNVGPVPISLFLHAETPNHESYNDHIVGALETTLAAKVQIQQKSRRYDTSVLTLGAQSAIDELQVLQLDEFQLPQATAISGRLFEYRIKDGYGPWLSDRLDRLRAPAVVPGRNDHFLAIPFYENISLLAYERADSDKNFPGDWKTLANACEKWEKKNPGDQYYFACPVAQSDRFESYNCLFFEILHSLQPPPTGGVRGGPPSSCDLYEWLFGPKNRSANAVRYFRRLVRRFHKANFLSDEARGVRANEREWRSRQMKISQDAKVWRHWYNTLNQMLSDLPPDKRSRIVVRPLYGVKGTKQDTMTTAGEWYLAVPVYSAAPEVALDIIHFLTTPEKEIQRAHLGIGLPTRRDFYEVSATGGSQMAAMSPYFQFDLQELKQLVTERAFQRSRFNCYETFAELVSSHLVRILELPDENLDAQVDGAMSSLKRSFEFVRRRDLCQKCGATGCEAHRSRERNGFSILS
jgi:KaiC/GvpD/RAD55 family RecA-like ATPase/ABC-type glycerol-3-phosphate transport system substrate-binding protein